MSKYTPGPWRVGFVDGSGSEHVVTVKITDTKLNLPDVICTMEREYSQEEYRMTAQAEANARLVAAAPELEKALLDYVETDAAAQHDGGGIGGEAFENARAALRKAGAL